jgi:hypothetical protein
MNYENQASQLKQAYQGNPGTPVADPYQQHRVAAESYYKACHNFQEASALRAECEKQLQIATQQLAEVMKSAQQDPTAPPPPNGVGQLGGVSGYQRGL